jgi:hypothetical protein
MRRLNIDGDGHLGIPKADAEDWEQAAEQAPGRVKASEPPKRWRAASARGWKLVVAGGGCGMSARLPSTSRPPAARHCRSGAGKVDYTVQTLAKEG